MCRAIFAGSLNILKKSKGEEDSTEVATGVIYDIEDSYAIKRRAVVNIRRIQPYFMQLYAVFSYAYANRQRRQMQVSVIGR